jgi:hypothetical protein
MRPFRAGLIGKRSSIGAVVRSRRLSIQGTRTYHLVRIEKNGKDGRPAHRVSPVWAGTYPGPRSDRLNLGLGLMMKAT